MGWLRSGFDARVVDECDNPMPDGHIPGSFFDSHFLNIRAGRYEDYLLQDVLPFVKTVGNRPAKTYGINTIGLERKGFQKETIEALQRAYRILIRSKLRLEEALQRIESELSYVAEAQYLVEFLRGSKRGFIR